MRAGAWFIYFFLPSLITLTDCSPLLIKVWDSVIFGLALILDVIPLARWRPEGGQMRGQLQSVAPGCVRNAVFGSKTVQPCQPELRTPSSVPHPAAQFG